VRTGALLVFVAACAEPSPNDDGLSGASPLVETIRAAGRRHRVAPGVLAALAWTASRGSMRGGEPAAYGGIGLTDLRAGGTLEEASRRTSLDPETLRRDAAANLEGGAAVLGARGREVGADPDEAFSFHDALVAYLGTALWADEVEDAMARGLEMTDDLGRSIRLAPRERFGTHELAARPDYPEAEWVGPSCNYQDASRGAGTIQEIVIHTCQGGFAGCWGWLLNCDSGVSAHYVVRSVDGHVVQDVEDQDVAWHDACNNANTIGIEHEGFVDDPDAWYTDEMYCGSANLVRWLAESYGIPIDRAHVYGHGEADDCSDHTDPGGGWDWAKYMDFVTNGCDCRPVPETCNCADDDCDGAVDDGACALAARAVDGSWPPLLEAGARANGWATFENTGTEPWAAAEVSIALAGETNLALALPPLPRDVPAGDVVRIDFEIEAPLDARLGPQRFEVGLVAADGTAIESACDGSGRIAVEIEVLAPGEADTGEDGGPDAGADVKAQGGCACASEGGSPGLLAALLLFGSRVRRRAVPAPAGTERIAVR